MIAVSFYTVSKKENSTKLPSNPVVMECSIKDDCSVLSPSLIIKAGTNTVPAFNYCYIQDFGRYYWITNWSWVRGVWQCACNVDVLASWRSYIGASNQYILRSASEYDGDIIDNLYPVKTRVESQFTNIDIFEATTIESGTFVIGVINQDIATNTITVGTVSYYSIDASNLKLLKAKLLDTSIWNSTIKEYANPLQFIISVMWFPISEISSTNPHLLKCGNVELTSVYVTDILDETVEREESIYPSIHPLYERGVYMLNKPYSSYTLYNDAFGSIPLDFSADTPTYDGSSFSRKGIKLRARIDLITGKCNMRVVISDSQSLVEHVITEVNASIATPIQLNQITGLSAFDITKAGVSFAGASGSLIAGNPAGAITGVLSGIGSLIEGSSPELINSGTNGSFNILNVPTVLKALFFIPVDEDIEHRGRPLCQERTINTLSGYVLCSDVELEIPCSADELTRIKTYMEGGFYYE